MLIKILANGYYARQDTKTPVKIGIIAMVSNMGFNLLAIPFNYVGLAIASAMSATLNAYLLYRGLVKADVYHFSRKSAVFFVKVLLAAIAMGAAVWYYVPEINQWAKMDFFMRVYWLVWLIVLAAIVLWRNVDFIRHSEAPFADKKLTSRYNAEILLFSWIRTCN